MVQAGLITKESALAELRSMGREVGAFSHLEPAEDTLRASAVDSLVIYLILSPRKWSDGF